MKNAGLILFTLIFSFSLVACGSNAGKDELEKNDTEKSPAKVEDGNQADTEATDDTTSADEDIWTYYEDADWQGEWEGLSFDIQKITVSDKAPKINDAGEEIEASAVGMKMKVENTNDDKVLSTYPDQATLITSTGEQVDADMFMSDSLGGEIHEGVIKEGNVIWYLDRDHAEEIEWVKIVWSSSYEDPEGNYENDKYKDHEVKIELK